MWSQGRELSGGVLRQGHCGELPSSSSRPAGSDPRGHQNHWRTLEHWWLDPRPRVLTAMPRVEPGSLDSWQVPRRCCCCRSGAAAAPSNLALWGQVEVPGPGGSPGSRRAPWADSLGPSRIPPLARGRPGPGLDAPGEHETSALGSPRPHLTSPFRVKAPHAQGCADGLAPCDGAAHSQI